MAYSQFYQAYNKKKNNGASSITPADILAEVNAKIEASTPKPAALPTPVVAQPQPQKTGFLGFLSGLQVAPPASKLTLGSADDNIKGNGFWEKIRTVEDNIGNNLNANPLYKGVANSLPVKALNRAAYSAANTMTGGGAVGSNPDLGTIGNTVTDFLGFGIGMGMRNPGLNGGSINSALSPVGNLAEKGVAKGLNKLGPVLPTTVNKVANYALPTAARGAAEFGLYGGANNAVQGKDIGEGALEGAASGALFNVGAKAIGSAVKGISKNAVKTNVTESKLSPINPNNVLKPINTPKTSIEPITGKLEGKGVITPTNAQIKDEAAPTMDLQTFGKEETVPDNGEVNISRPMELTTGGERKTSKFYSNSLKETEIIPEEVKGMFDEAEFQYNTKTNADDLARAKRNIETKGIKGVIDEHLQNNSDKLTSTQVMENFLITKELAAKAKETGLDSDYRNLLNWTKINRGQYTEAGQAIQAISVYKKSTPEGMLLEAEKQIDNATKKVLDDNPKLSKEISSKTDEVAKAMNDINTETAEQVAKEVAENVDNIVSGGKGKGGSKKSKTNNLPKEEISPEEKLAKRVDNYTVEKPAKETDVEKETINTLFNIAKKSLPEKERMPKDPLEFVKLAIKDRNKYQEVWQNAKAILQEKYADNPEKLSILEDYLNGKLRPTFETTKLNQAISQRLKAAKIDLNKLVRENYTVQGKIRTDLKERLINEAGLSGEEAEILSKYINNRMKELTKEKKEKALAGIFKEKVKGETKTATKSIQELSNLGAFKNDNYSVLVEGKVSPKVDKLIKDNLDIGNMVRKLSQDNQELTKGRILNHILETTSLDKNDADKLAQIVLNRFDELTSKKKQSILNSMFKPREKSPEKSMIEKIVELSNLGAFDKTEYKDLIGEKYGIPSLTKDDLKFITNTMEKAQKLEGREKDIEIAKVTQLIADKIPSSMPEKVRAWQRISMLLNPKTMARNTLGNLVMGGLENLKDLPATALDKGLSKMSGVRTTGISSLGTQLKAGKEGIKQVRQDAKLGIDTSPSKGQYDLPTGRTFNNSILNKLDKMTKHGLQYGDVPFYKAAYEDSLRQQMKLNNVKEPTEEMIQLAKEVAENRTFQNVSAIANSFEHLRKALNGEKEGSAKKSFGLGNLIIPFTKTPANILDKAIDYSPAAALKLAKQFVDIRKEGLNTFNQKKFVDTFGRGVTGTSIIILGYKLAESGLMNGAANKDADKAAMDKLSGDLPYSFKIDGTSYTFDWAQPSSVPLAIGADVYESGKGKEGLWNTVVSAVQSGGTTLFNQSLFQSLQKLMGGYDPVGGLTKTAQAWPSQFMPTALKQVAQAIDETTRSTYDPDGGKAALNVIQSKVPFATEKLQPKVNVLGEDTKTYDSKGIARLGDIFLNPGFHSSQLNNKGVELVKKIYDETGETKQFPRVADKSFIVDGEKITLTANEYTEYQRMLGQKTNEYLNSLKDTGKYSDMADDIQSKISDINKEIKAKILEDRGTLYPSFLKDSITEQIKYNTSDKATSVRKKADQISSSNRTNEEKAQLLKDLQSSIGGMKQGKTPKKKKESTLNPFDR